MSVHGAFFADGKSQHRHPLQTNGLMVIPKQRKILYNFPLRIAPYEKVVAYLYVAQYEMNLKYKAVFRHKSLGKYYIKIGVWQDVDRTDINVYVQRYDATGKIKSTTKFSGIPNQL